MVQNTRNSIHTGIGTVPRTSCSFLCGYYNSSRCRHGMLKERTAELDIERILPKENWGAYLDKSCAFFLLAAKQLFAEIYFPPFGFFSCSGPYHTYYDNEFTFQKQRACLLLFTIRGYGFIIQHDRGGRMFQPMESSG